MRAADGRHSRFRKTEVFDLALADQVLDGSGDILDGHFRVDTMLVEKIDDAGLESPERGLGDLADMRGPAVETDDLAGIRIEFEAELRGDHSLSTDGGQGF